MLVQVCRAGDMQRNTPRHPGGGGGGGPMRGGAVRMTPNARTHVAWACAGVVRGGGGGVAHHTR